MIDFESYGISISKERLSELPVVRFPGRISVLETADAALEALSFLSSQEIVGFDTETRPSFRKGHFNDVSLIQISTIDHSFLFRLNKLGFFDELRSFMENDGVKKVGLSLKDDFCVLHRHHEFEPAGFIDLQNLVKDYHITDSSLQKIYGIMFDERISKNQRLSNWEADHLSEGQQIYASIDAWACLKIYRHLTMGNFDPERSSYIVHINQTEQ